MMTRLRCWSKLRRDFLEQSDRSNLEHWLWRDVVKMVIYERHNAFWGACTRQANATQRRWVSTDERGWIAIVSRAIEQILNNRATYMRRRSRMRLTITTPASTLPRKAYC